MEFNLADLYEAVADAVPERVALVAGDRRLTYRDLDERANRVAHYLRDVGVLPGQHVGIYSFNRAEWVESMLGCFKARAVPDQRQLPLRGRGAPLPVRQRRPRRTDLR